jgi:hypothetical protein
MKINTCSECKRWKRAMRKHNKIMGVTTKQCNRYGFCKYQDECMEWDNYHCAYFKKSLKLSIIQWLYKHGIKIFR